MTKTVPRRSLIIGVISFALIIGAVHASAQELVVHRSTEIQSLSRNEARLYFTMRVKAWPNGALVKVFVLPDDHELHRIFAKSVLGLFPYQLRRVWDRQLFSGTGRAPTTVADEQEMLERIASTPGAIGYTNGPFNHSNLRVLEVR
jgi:hypothetical protein